MPSWQSYVANAVLRYTVKRKLARSTTPFTARAAFSSSLPPPPGARFSADTIAGISGEWARSDKPGIGTLLYLHGGGYFACSPKTHRSITGAYAIRGFDVFSPDYRLAPEHPFPAAIDDALAVYRAMLATVPEGQFAIGGDSAGGGLTLATLLAAKSAGLPMPACALLFSPWTDLTGASPSVKSNEKRDSMLYGPKLVEAGQIYLNGADAKNPLASPLFGDLKGLPPLLIQVSDCEVLLDDSRRIAENARRSGVAATLQEWPGQPHGWQIYGPILPEARAALRDAADFISARLAPGNHSGMH